MRGQYIYDNWKDGRQRQYERFFENLEQKGIANLINTELKNRLIGEIERKPIFIPNGEMIGYKKVYVSDKANGRSSWSARQVVLKVVIPEYADVVCYEKIRNEEEAKTVKHRASEAYIECAYDLKGNIATIGENEVMFSGYDRDYTYEIGTTAYPKNGFSNTPNTCGGGIHFFRSIDAAKAY